MAPAMYRYQLSKFSLGKARSLAPIMIGDEKVAQHAGQHRHQEQEDHDNAVRREDLVVLAAVSIPSGEIRL